MRFCDIKFFDPHDLSLSTSTNYYTSNVASRDLLTTLTLAVWHNGMVAIPSRVTLTTDQSPSRAPRTAVSCQRCAAARAAPNVRKHLVLGELRARASIRQYLSRCLRTLRKARAATPGGHARKAFVGATSNVYSVYV